jgi:type IV secretory pathway VirB3-like protein
MEQGEFMRMLGVGLVFLVKPFLLVVLLAVPLWLVRKYVPSAEFWLFSPLSRVIRRLTGFDRQESRSVLRHDQEDPSPSRPNRLGR